MALFNSGYKKNAMLPTDLERLILRYAAVYYPWKQIHTLQNSVIKHQRWVVRDLRRAFGPYAWSPTFCNVLNWAWLNPRRQMILSYAALTHMTPTRKEIVEEFRREAGFAPIYPGDRHYPTCRVRFDPKFHTNDRYFR